MRALCGAIITAGALIGLGLTAIGIGERYHSSFTPTTASGEREILHLADMDRPLIFILVFMTCAAVIGLGIAFLGLAYHHYRRHHEHVWELERRGAVPRHETVPPSGTP
jgi:hypothetical protein